MQPLANLSSIVHFHRKQAGLSRAALARLAGVGKTVLYDVEHGKTTVRLDTLLKILSALNIRVDWDSPLKAAMPTDETTSASKARGLSS